MNANTINEMRVHIETAVVDKGCLDIIWDVAPTEVDGSIFCTAMIRDGGKTVIGTCGNAYDFEEVGTIDLVAYKKRGEGDFDLRTAVDEIEYFLRNSRTANIRFDDISQDVPLEAEQSDFAMFLQVAFRAYTSELINK